MNELPVANDVISKFRLPPGFKLEAWWEPGGDAISLQLAANVQDSRNPNERVLIHACNLVDGLDMSRCGDDLAALFRVHITNLVREMWWHELDEWLTYDGVHVKDPHPSRHIDTSNNSQQKGNN